MATSLHFKTTKETRGVINSDSFVVGKDLVPILQINILTLSGNLSFQSFFQLTFAWRGGGGGIWVVSWYADFIENFPLGFCSQISFSGLEVVGRCMKSMALADSGSNKSLMILVFQAKDSWSMS